MSVVLLAIVASGCTAQLKAIGNYFAADPVNSSLIVVRDQWEVARNHFYAQDAAAIVSCIDDGGVVEVCRIVRCSSAPCTTFRQIDPKVMLAYNAARQMRSIASVTEFVGKATDGLVVLEEADPKNADVYRAIRQEMARQQAALVQ